MPRRHLLYSVIAILMLGTTASAQSAPSFVNDVEPILHLRLGCNQRRRVTAKARGRTAFACRCAAMRRMGPRLDRANSRFAASIRRIPKPAVVAQADRQAPHEGGVLMSTESRAYKVLLDWIRAGAPGITRTIRAFAVWRSSQRRRGTNPSSPRCRIGPNTATDKRKTSPG